jgi:glycine/D-amino acid oxidase-like deaminating enzyme
MKEPEQHADIVIVGAGLAGAATAYHLARLGRRDILILEQEAIAGAHSSGRNAAIVRAHADDAAVQKLVSEGAEELRGGHLAEFHRNGIMLMNIGDEDVGQYFPRARGRGRWCPDDGVIDVAGLLRTYLAGQRVHYDTRVLEWSATDEGLRVSTSRGQVRCRRLINAAGPWAGTLGGLPMTPMNRHLFVTLPLSWVRPSAPTVWDGRRGLYFRPESGGLLLCCCDETPAAPGDYREDQAMLDELHEKVTRLQPGLGELAIRASWVGQRTFAPDRKFVVGFDPRNRRVFHVAGLGGHGVTASSAVGRLAADMILGRSRSQGGAFAPDRLLAARWAERTGAAVGA